MVNCRIFWPIFSHDTIADTFRLQTYHALSCLNVYISDLLIIARRIFYLEICTQVRQFTRLRNIFSPITIRYICVTGLPGTDTKERDLLLMRGMYGYGKNAILLGNYAV